MSSVYSILSEFTDTKDPDTISVSPYWVMAVIRFAQPLTFSRSKMFTGASSTSYDANSESLINERTMLVLADDVTQMSITHNKGSYISSLSATLANGDMNYLTEIQPNDWIMAWIVNDETTGLALKARIQNHEACNSFMDGLKFVGRVQSIRKMLQQAPSGHRETHYQLQAAGFKELDSSVFFDPALSQEEKSFGLWLQEQNIELSDVFTESSSTSGGISTTKVIPILLKIMVGSGVSKTLAAPGGVQVATGATATPEAPYAYAVPRSVLELLGQPTTSKSVPSYADILELVIGLQKYENAGPAATPETIFSPQGSSSSSNHRVLNDKLLGTFQPLPVAFNGKSVWSFMEEFKNPAVNEMFTSLRVNPNGSVVPTMTVRQLPFSTSYAMENGDSSQLTGFLEVPRWFCDPILVNSLDIGKSDATHVNFIHIYGQASADSGVDLTLQIIQFPPIRDEQDIKRSGLRPHMQTVACSIDSALKEPRKWMEIISDFLIGQQYTLNGTCNMIGIQAPICPGDNFEFDDTVYHIEAVTHNVGIQQGFKSFSTSLSLTHGMRTDTPVFKDNATTKNVTTDIAVNAELLIYTSVDAQDNLGYDPGTTAEFKVANPEQAEAKNESEAGAGGLLGKLTDGIKGLLP